MAVAGLPVGADVDDFVEFCARALPEVYGYLLARCGDADLAEDLTSETFTAAVSALNQGHVPEITVGWVIVVARRRLVDHWRRREREHRLFIVCDPPGVDDVADPWTEAPDVELALRALERVGPHHRAALTLRYLDGLSVTEVACILDRGLHATEALLQRARRALRRAYEEVQAHA